MCPDVAVVMVSPPDEHGYVSFGTTVDYTKGVCGVVKTVIARSTAICPAPLATAFAMYGNLTPL